MLSALAQSTGEAIYISTMELDQRCLHCYPVFAGIPKGRFKYNFSLDQLRKEFPQLVDFVTAKDIPGQNLIGGFAKQKLILTEEDEILAPSVVLGLVVTCDSESAFNIAKLVVKRGFIQLQESPDAVVDLMDAIQRKQFACEKRLDGLGGVQKPGQQAFENKIFELQSD